MATLDPEEAKEIWERIRATEVRVEESAKALAIRWHDQETALVKATHALEERLELLNELRGGVLTRAEYDGKHGTLRNEVQRNRESIDQLRGEYVTTGENQRTEDRLSRLENWRANVMGRAVAVGILGAIFVAGMAAILTHLAVK